MKVLMISFDRKLFESDSNARSRILEYGELFGELHIIVFSLKKLNLVQEKIADNVILYPTNASYRLLYMNRAFSIAKTILSGKKLDEWVVSTQDPFETGIVGLKVRKKFNVPLHVQIHTDFLSPYFKSESFLNRVRVYIAGKVLPKANCVRVVSKRIYDSIKKHHTFDYEPQILPIFKDISQIESRRPTFDIRKMYKQFDFIALMISRLEAVKDVPLTITAFRKVVDKYENAGLIIVGDGREKAMLEKLVLKLNLGKNVVFKGWQDDVISFYRGADVFLNSSKHEGYCLSLVEAAAARCPIITTDVGTVGDVLNKTNVCVCPVGDKECFENKIMSAINNVDILNNLRKKAFADIKESTQTKVEYLKNYKKGLETCRK